MVAIDPRVIARAVSTVAGFKQIWLGTFDGSAGSAVDTSVWNIMTDIHVNNEMQQYTTSTDNLRHSGNGTLQIIPLKSDAGQWTSGRIESTASYTPEDGKVARFQSLLRFGDAPKDQQQGIWPAFWMLGESSRKGTPWPECGELDIMERINGMLEGHGTPHCGDISDPCGGKTKTTPLADNDWHTWAIEVDRKNKDWKQQEVRWMLDDKEYNKMSGADLGDEKLWASVAHSPFYFILNVAVGGNWPGNANDKTVDGTKSMMEVQYLAAYTSE